MLTHFIKFLAPLFVVIFLMFPARSEGQNVIWAKGSLEYGFGSLYGGYYVDAYTTASATDNKGNLYVTGVYENCSISFGGIDLYGATASGNTFIIKYDSSGNVLWGICSTGGAVYSSGIATDKQGNVIVTGSLNAYYVGFGGDSARSNRHGFTNYFLYKFDSAGNVIWYKNGNGWGFDNNGNYDVHTDNNGDVYFLGTYGTQSISFGTYLLTNSAPTYSVVFMGDTSYTTDIFLVKYDPNGNVLWAKNAGGTSEDQSGMLAVDNDGNAYINGQYTSTSITFGTYTLTNSFGTFGAGFSPNIYVVKYSANGDVLWASNIGANSNVNAGGIVNDINNNVYITGSFQVGLFPGGAALTCDTPSHSNGFFAKYDSSGNFVSALQFGGNGNAGGTNLAYGAKSGDVYLCGYFDTRRSISIGLTNIPQLDTFSWGSTSFILAYSPTHTVSEVGDCFVEFDVPYDRPYAAVDANENLYMNGIYRGTMNIRSGDSLQNSSESSIYSMRFQNCVVIPETNGVPATNKKCEIELYPNPATGEITLYYPGFTGNQLEIEIYDLAGRLLQSKVLTNNIAILPLSALSPGTYICKTTVDGVVTVKKFVVY